MEHRWRQLLILAILLASGDSTSAQAVVNGSALALRSNGSAQGGAWTLNNNGYVGTYVTLDAPGGVTVSIQATGQEFAGVAPRMNVAVADSVAGFDVASGVAGYEHTFALPAGTHFIRTEFNNDPQQTARSLTVQNLAVTGATIANSNSSANALAAADSYISSLRRGPARLELVGVDAGATVKVKLARHDFRFGTAVGARRWVASTVS
jgi:hypothetical protein